MNNARKLHAKLLKTGRDAHPVSLSHLVKLCGASSSDSDGASSYARALFHLIPYPDTFAYNIIIKAHSSHPSLAPYAVSYFSRMRRSGVPSDGFTFPFVIKSCAHLRFGTELHSLVFKLGFDSVIYVQNALISLYGGCGYVKPALELFDEMRERDLVSWSTVISCFVNNGLWSEALGLFQQMQLVGDPKPDGITMLSVISAISRLGNLELGKWVDEYIRRSELKLTVPLGTALIDMYSRCGSVDDGVKTFDKMPEQSVATWTALINGLAMHGRSRQALQAFYKMEKSGLTPDHITFRAVLVGCSHGGLVEDGWRVFYSIMHRYRMQPTLEQYGCMVDMLGRAGLVHQAFELVEKMPVRPNTIIWRTLLGACVTYNCPHLAEKAKERISELDPDHDGDYVLLSNAYGGVGRWGEKAKVRISMKERRISKTPGYSLA